MEDVLFRFSIVWTLLHIILFFVEWYRYKHSIWSWYGFMKDGMLEISYIILSLDAIGVIATIIIGLGYCILQPIIK